ncbi:hypothetical protein [Streptomyces sp. Isolate_45]|uniref:hypothetical protein n=1 Tax=Streptomyces sp. Isolate_45 TaxID=2950111 RepID=UPI002481D648|nr:hypothetical protein [Streptomyces sp. Isolate_45]MDA5286011.1 hypothetical protein [Streptomyces sp. Isolate_45]
MHDGDDPRIRNLLVELAAVADTDALLHLRRRLYDSGAAPGPATDETLSPRSDGPAPPDWAQGRNDCSCRAGVESVSRRRSGVEGRK